MKTHKDIAQLGNDTGKKKMNIITEKSQIEQILEGEIENAFPTSRCLPGSWESENCQEWKAYTTIDGAPAAIYWVFENSVCVSEDASDYPWEDADKVTRVEVADADEDGEYDEI